MEAFLKITAKDLYKRFGMDLSRVAVIFPNKRASLFFNEYLANEASAPVWSPAYLSISELIQQLSPLQTGDPIKLVCELYKIFIQETKSEESLDDFYFWGELLISDFDDVDKNMVDAGRLFSNILDLKNMMDSFDFLDKEQEEAIQQFFQNFSIERRTELKKRFISLWDVLGTIYVNYKARLLEQGIAYEGMIYRSVIEQLDVNQLKYDKYVFVGFNVLNKVETKFFQLLRDSDKALFYWDYDVFYTKTVNHEAGEFIKRNLKEFTSSLPGDELFNTLGKPKKVRYISSPTENGQARFLPEWVQQVSIEKESESAVVLCNEALLLPILHSIPKEVQNINITMGFPLMQTPVYSFINALTELHTNGYRQDTGRYAFASVLSVLKHPYTRKLSKQAELLEKELTKNNRFYPVPSELKKDDFLSMLFTPQLSIQGLCDYLLNALQQVAQIYHKEEKSDDVFNQLYRESLFKAFTSINRVYGLVSSGDLTVNIETFKRLMNNILSSANIPFHGEPAIGMQIMGVLETRNLDFKNLLILSLNEGKLPKSGGDSSFIPYNLRKAFGMTTIEHKNAVYAYYFYRLMQRAENITLMYNTSTDGLNRGEWSRFMLQFLIEWPHEITREYLEAGQSPQGAKEICIKKNDEIMNVLYRYYDVQSNSGGKFSPSALNIYLDCRLKFYFKYVARISTEQEVSQEIDSATFGNIFHRSAELVYKELTINEKLIRKEDLENLLHEPYKIQDYVDTAFKELFFNMPINERPEYNGVQLINSTVIASYLKQLLLNDLQYAPFDLLETEYKVDEILPVSTPKRIINIKIGGTIDRIDKKGDVLRIVDYKTGGNPRAVSNLNALFTPAEGRPNYIFQTFLYAAILSKKTGMKIAPSLLYIHRAASESYSPVIEMGEARQPKVPVDNFAEYEQEFRELLNNLLTEIFNPAEDFKQTEITKNCEYCDFKAICKR